MVAKTKIRKTVSSKIEAPADRTTAYAKDVCSGLILAGPYVRAACARHLRDLEHGAVRGIYFDPTKANRALRFFEEILRLNGGDFEGMPFHLESFEAFIVGSLFGWVKADGYRRFRVAFIEIGKGNGKSPLAAGIGLLCLTADGESRPEVYAAASKREQAMIMFRDAVAMVDQSPDLRGRITKFGGSQPWNLLYQHKDGFFRVVSSENGQSGYRVHCALLDEIHEHNDDVVVNMMRAGTKGRKQALIIEITNSGVSKTSICYDHHKYSVDVVEGRIEEKQSDSWFAYVCALDTKESSPTGVADDPFEDETCWPKANPNLGVSIKPDYIRDLVSEARGMPSKASTVRRLNFCQWVDSYSPWIDSIKWEACEKKDFDDARLTGLRGACAVDLSQTTDLTAVAFAFEIPTVDPVPDVGADAVVTAQSEEDKRRYLIRSVIQNKRVAAFVLFFTPADTLKERTKRDRVPYDLWVEQRHVIATLGSVVDYAEVALQLLGHVVRFAPITVVADPYRLPYLKKEVDLQAGLDAVPIISHPQGGYKAKDTALWMPHSVELLEGLVLEGRLEVQWNPCLTWNSASAVLEQINKQGSRIFNKVKSTGRIDGLVALTMAIGALLTVEPQEELDSVYNARARRKQRETIAVAEARRLADEMGAAVSS